MPIYEYLCEKCGSEIERVQKITDPPLAIHADCGGKLTRLISNSSFVLKGNGWYVTDYPSESRKKAQASETKPAKPAKKTEGKTASTPSSCPASQ